MRPGVSSTAIGRLYRHSYSSLASAAVASASKGSTGTAGIEPGRLVEFRRGGDYLLGLVIKLGNKNNWAVEDPSGTVYSVPSRDVTCVLPGSNCTQSELAALAHQAAELADTSLLQLAWEVSEPTAMYSVQEMASFIFGEETAATCAASHRLLREDRVFFKHAGRSPPTFSPRTPDQVEQLQRQAEAAQKEEESWQQFAAALDSARKLPRSSKPGPVEWEGGEHAERVLLLRGYATGEGCDGDKVKAIQVLNELRMSPTPLCAAEILQGIGYWQPHLQLSLLTAGITEEFRPELEGLARQVVESPPPDPDAHLRRDFTHMAVVTIDDEKTTEIDDGLSVERLPSGDLKVWVHVADPTRWLVPGGGLDLEARRRTTSLYLPTGMIPMFPKTLSEGPFSLRQGQRCAALSVGIVLGEDGSVLLDRLEVVPSTITPSRRLTYDTADEMYEECPEEMEPDLFDLLKAAQLRREYRTSRGATEINLPECEVTVDDPQADAPRVTLLRYDQFASVSRQVVAEMMILAGEAMGLLGGGQHLPLPYRGQPEPVLPEQAELDSVPEGPCQAIMLRNRMIRSVTTARAPVPHAGLGLAAYVQITSPIRRYGDLLAHWQIKAQLRGEPPPFNPDELAILMDGVTGMTQKMNKLQREVETYWVCVYFQQQMRANPRAAWHAMLLCWFKQDVGLARVLLPHLGLESVVKVTRGGAVPGSTFFVRCSQADPRQGVFRLDEVTSSYVDEEDVVGADLYDDSYVA